MIKYRKNRILNNNLIYFIVICYFARPATVNSSVLFECCPSDLQLEKTITGAQTYRTDRYFCSNRTSSFYDSAVWRSNDTSINGLNIIQAGESRIPSCETYKLRKVTNKETLIYVPNDSCISHYLNGTYILQCDSLLDSHGVPPNHITAHVVQKCCPFGQLYDKKNFRCIGTQDHFKSNLKEFFRQPAIIIDDELKCPLGQEVTVDFHYKYFKFSIEGNELSVAELGMKYKLNAMCIESVFDYESSAMRKISDNFYDHQPNYSFMVRTCNFANICQQVPCIRRCCQRNEKRVKVNQTTTCRPDKSKTDIEMQFHGYETLNGVFKSEVIETRAYGTLYGQTCRMYKLDPSYPHEMHIFNYQDGALYLPNEVANNYYPNSEYCIEKLETPSGSQMLGTFVCFASTEKEDIKFKVYSVGILISCVFFFITLLVYLFVPKLRNLPGKILICLVTSLLVAYIGIAIGQMNPPSDNRVCYSFAFFIYFSTMSAFSWMNIMCFDIWLTFGSTSRPRSINRHEWGRFLIYSLYGWGMPTLITLLTVAVTRLNLISDELQPKFGEGRCWFQHAHAKPHLLFFLGPVGILFMFNLVLFILTLKYCNQVKRDIQRMQSTNTEKPIIKSRFSVDRARFAMNTKLFIVMGITWFLEILSTIFYDRNNEFWWYACDISNVLQGVLVFFVFVFKRRVWYAVLDRFGIKYASNRKSTTMATTSTFTGVSSVNLHRMRSMESASSLLATNATSTAAHNGRSYYSQLPYLTWKELLLDTP